MPDTNDVEKTILMEIKHKRIYLIHETKKVVLRAKTEKARLKT